MRMWVACIPYPSPHPIPTKYLKDSALDSSFDMNSSRFTNSNALQISCFFLLYFRELSTSSCDTTNSSSFKSECENTQKNVWFCNELDLATNTVIVVAHATSGRSCQVISIVVENRRLTCEETLSQNQFNYKNSVTPQYQLIHGKVQTNLKRIFNRNMKQNQAKKLSSVRLLTGTDFCWTVLNARSSLMHFVTKNG